MTNRARVVADCYVDSVRLLEATRAMTEAPGVDLGLGAHGHAGQS